MTAPRFPITVQLSGTDGNVYSIISTVCQAMKRAGLHTEAQQFKRDCFAAGSYDKVLQLAMRTVEVE